ncbi:uncharacterized protein LOC133320424 [Danaus plexippus]|uniref:uncharacterized protein LOC133320424 n=1 Tax=Danaus plexippus TaxID=13037 RepID=UPI002AB13BDE|nr:uncharacterized protein LOC133320424 [Danaus plexippus]
MILKLVVMLAVLVCCDCILYSSFWAPLFNPKILGYRVDIPFNPEAGKNNRDDYKNNYGYKGERLIADLGNGNGPPQTNLDGGKVNFYYTYGGVYKQDDINKHEYNKTV